MPVGDLFKAGADIYASTQAANSAKNALSYQKSIGSDVMPYINAGTNASGILSDPNKLMSNFMTDPSYQFNLQQGLGAVGQDKAVNGLLRSGGAIKGLDTFAQGLAGNQFNSYVGRLQNTASMGLQAGSVAAGAANSSSNIAMTNGANQADAGLAAGNNFGAAVGNLWSTYGGGSRPNGPSGGTSSYGTT